MSIFYTLEPKVDILVIGIGDQKVTPELSIRIIQFMKKYKINVEILRTEQVLLNILESFAFGLKRKLYFCRLVRHLIS